jgi:hypothetical protein
MLKVGDDYSCIKSILKFIVFIVFIVSDNVLRPPTADRIFLIFIIYIHTHPKPRRYNGF